MTFEMLEERGSIPGVEECIKDGVEEVVLTLLALFSSVRGRRRALNNPSNRGSSRAIEAEFEVPERDSSNCHDLHCFLCRTSQDADKRLKFRIVDLISILHKLSNFEAN